MFFFRKYVWKISTFVYESSPVRAKLSKIIYWSRFVISLPLFVHLTWGKILSIKLYWLRSRTSQATEILSTNLFKISERPSRHMSISILATCLGFLWVLTLWLTSDWLDSLLLAWETVTYSDKRGQIPSPGKIIQTLTYRIFRKLV